MAHWARLNKDLRVEEVVVVDNSWTEEETLNWLAQFGDQWLQTSYNRGQRARFAGVGYTYDPRRDAFIPPRPYASWLLDEATLTWQAPQPSPQDGEAYAWDDYTLSWRRIEALGEQR